MVSINSMLLCFIASLNLSCTEVARAQPASIWVGRYLYQGSEGKTYGGSYIGEDIFLTIEKNGKCNITEQGYMLDKKILCRTNQKRWELEIIYSSHLDQNDPCQGPDGPVPLYKEDDVLFSLERVGFEKILITHWKKMQAYGVRKKTGRYFEQVF